MAAVLEGTRPGSRRSSKSERAKTRRCRYLLGARGCRNGVDCKFAHSDGELRQHPNDSECLTTRAIQQLMPLIEDGAPDAILAFRQGLGRTSAASTMSLETSGQAVRAEDLCKASSPPFASYTTPFQSPLHSPWQMQPLSAVYSEAADIDGAAVSRAPSMQPSDSAFPAETRPYFSTAASFNAVSTVEGSTLDCPMFGIESLPADKIPLDEVQPDGCASGRMLGNAVLPAATGCTDAWLRQDNTSGREFYRQAGRQALVCMLRNSDNRVFLAKSPPVSLASPALPHEVHQALWSILDRGLTPCGGAAQAELLEHLLHDAMPEVYED